MTRFIKLTQWRPVGDTIQGDDSVYISPNSIASFAAWRGASGSAVYMHGDDDPFHFIESPDRILLLCDEAAMAELEGAE